MSNDKNNVTNQKRTKGRKRIEIKKIEDKASLQVTFSKRRSGLFKKAGQLSRLCQAEVAILVFSPHGRAYVFGHPSADDVINRLESTSVALHGGQNVSMHVSGGDYSNDTGSNSTTYQTSPNDEESVSLGLACGGVMKEEKEEKEAEIGSGGFWWDQPTKNMKLNELKHFKTSLEELRGKIAMHMDETSSRNLALRNFLGPKLG